MAFGSIWKFGADNSDFKKAVREMPSEMDKSARQIERATKGTGGAFERLGQDIKSAALAFVSLGTAVQIGRDFFNTVVEVERLRGSLETIEGSTDKANAAFKSIQQFAASTPFQLEAVTAAFITLKTRGLDATNESLTAVGNLAAAFGKDIKEVAQAVANATTGEMEMLKQLGIVARVEGDKVRFIFKGTATEVGRNAEEITQYLYQLGQTEFSGAMERQMDRIGGKISNLSDAFSQFYTAIGDAGATNEISSVIEDVTKIFAELTETIGKVQAVGPAIKEEDAQTTVKNLQFITDALKRTGSQGTLFLMGLKDLGLGLSAFNSLLGESEASAVEAAEDATAAVEEAEKAAKASIEARIGVANLMQSLEESSKPAAERVKDLREELERLYGTLKGTDADTAVQKQIDAVAKDLHKTQGEADKEAAQKRMLELGLQIKEAEAAGNKALADKLRYQEDIEKGILKYKDAEDAYGMAVREANAELKKRSNLVASKISDVEQRPAVAHRSLNQERADIATEYNEEVEQLRQQELSSNLFQDAIRRLNEQYDAAIRNIESIEAERVRQAYEPMMRQAALTEPERVRAVTPAPSSEQVAAEQDRATETTLQKVASFLEQLNGKLPQPVLA